MRNSLLLILIALFSSLNSIAMEKPVVSLLTCDAGQELYSTFGHSAIRVRYPSTREDLVFNFGLFDFSTPNFYWKFMRGKLNYMLGIQYMDDFVQLYRWEQRSVKEQVLSLDSTQTKALIKRLEYLYQPQNRYYLYSFLYKNCTTELRDIIYPLVDGAEENFKTLPADATDRELINQCVEGWPKFGISLILGSRLDKDISLYQGMFLPERLFEGIALLQNGELPMVEQTNIIYSSTKSEVKNNFLSTIASPLLVFLILLIPVLYGFYNRKVGAIYSNIYLSIITFLGLFLSFIIVITEHQELYSNYNLLWCNPLFFLLLLSSFKGWRNSIRLFAALSILSLALLQLVWATKLQYAEPGFVVVVITLALIFIQKIIFTKPARKIAPDNS